MKKPSPLGEGSGWFLGSAPLAPIPPSSLPPAAGNEYEYALNTNLNRAKESEEGYVDQAEVVSGNLHTPSIRPDGDGDAAAVSAVEQTQLGSP
jgi:hypothetical protein